MPNWEGTATDLFEEVVSQYSAVRRYTGWPSSPKALSDRLRRMAPNLKEVGIEVDFRRRNVRRLIRLTFTGKFREVLGDIAAHKLELSLEDER